MRTGRITDLSASIAAGDEPEAGTLYSTSREAGIDTGNLGGNADPSVPCICMGWEVFYFPYPAEQVGKPGRLPIKQTGGIKYDRH